MNNNIKKERKNIILVFIMGFLLLSSISLVSASVLQDVVNVGERIVELINKLFSFGDSRDGQDGELGSLGAFGDETGISVLPSSISIENQDEFDVNISVNDITDLYGFQFDLTYNSNVLEFVSMNEGEFLKRDGRTIFFDYSKQTPGFINNVYATKTGAIPGISGTGFIATIRFKATSEGSSNIAISESQLIDSSVSQIVHVINNGIINVGSVVTCVDADADGHDAIDAVNCPSGDDCDDGDGNRYPSNPEICDNKDNDCDSGTVDGVSEIWYNKETSCGIGVCTRNGNWLCIGGVKLDSCSAGSPTEDDSNCNGLDDDCDGTVDEGCSYCTISDARFLESIIKNNTEIQLLVNGNDKCNTSQIVFEIYNKNNTLIGNNTGIVGDLSIRYTPKSNIESGLYEIYFKAYPKENSTLKINSSSLLVKPDKDSCFEGSSSSLRDNIYVNNIRDDLNALFNETKVPVRYEKNDKTVFNLSMDCTLDKIDLDRLNVSLQNESLIRTGYTIINNLNLSNKNVFVDKINNSNRLCIRDIYSVDGLNCNSSNGIIINCPGNISQYSCSIIENRYAVSNLSHSGVFELEAVCGDSLCNGNEECSSCALDCGTCASPGETSSGSTGSTGTTTPPIVTIKTNQSNASSNVSDQLQVEENQSEPAKIDFNQTGNETDIDKSFYDKLKESPIIYISILVFIVVFLVILAFVILFYNKWKRKNKIKETKTELKGNFKQVIVSI